jgi:hypothetical protein
VDADGRLIALNAYNHQYGYVTLTSADPFPEDQRYNPQAVRAYRATLGKLAGFGVTFDVPIVDRTCTLLHDAIPQVELKFENGASAECVTWATQGGAFQKWVIKGDLKAHWQGHLSLQRSAYTQLTEGGVLPMPRLWMNVAFATGKLTIFNPELKCAVAVIAGFRQHEPFNIWADGLVVPNFPLDESEVITLVYGIGSSTASALELAHHLTSDVDYLLDIAKTTWSQRWENITPDQIVRRGLVYGSEMCIPVDDGVCILTDHMLLPLSWNRDAYYVALALLHWHPDMHDLVRRHLIWMFEIAERSNGDWGRCYLANGKVKDHAYQLDQQLFPLLELADYVNETGDSAFLLRVRPHITDVIDALNRRRDPRTGLFATEETPADDPIPLPFHLSSHILLWYTLRRLHPLLPDAGLNDMAAQTRTATNQYFITTAADGRSLYAYAIDGQGHYHRYHDANDFPLVLAPVWGFCAADDPLWRATIDFAFSSENPAVYDGRLGSVHTPAPWALGDLQDVLVGKLLNDPQREAAAWDRLRQVAQIDGGLPEAYDSNTGAVISRFWFAWTNAVAACIRLGVWDMPSRT